MSEHLGKAFIEHLLRRVEAMEVITPQYKAIRSIASYVSDLEARLEKAEAERDQLAEQQIAAVNDLQTARNDALEEAADRCAGLRKKHSSPTGDAYTCGTWDHGVRIESAIRALKSKS